MLIWGSRSSVSAGFHSLKSTSREVGVGGGLHVGCYGSYLSGAAFLLCWGCCVVQYLAGC